MATVTITGGTGDAGAVGDNRPWKLWAAVYQSDGAGGVVTTSNDREVNVLRPVGGVLTFEAEAGIAAYIETPDKRRYLVTIPQVNGALWDLIAASIAFPPETPQALLNTAVGQYVESNREQFRTRAVPVDPDDPNTLYQWVDANGDEIGDPVPLPDIVSVAWDGIPDKPDVIGAGATKAAARNAIGAASLADVAPAVAAAVAAAPAVTAAAAAAVTSEIAGRDMLEGSDARLAQPVGESPGIWEADVDEDGKASRILYSDGTTFFDPHPDVKISAVNLGPDISVSTDLPTDETVVDAVLDADGLAAFAIYANGSVDLLSPTPDTLAAFERRPVPTWMPVNRVKKWSSEQGVYNLNPTRLRRWGTALSKAAAGTGTAHATAFLDSNTYGAGTSLQPAVGSWPGRLRRMLDAYTGFPGGTGMVPLLNITTQSPALDTRLAFGVGSVTTASSYVTQLAGNDQATPNCGVQGRGAIRLTNSTGAGWLSFAPAGAVDRFVIYALADSGASGTATVKIDGSSVGTFDVSAAGGGGTLTRRTGFPSNVIVIDVPGLSSATHTLRIEGPAASTVTIWAVEGGTGKGVRISNLARSSNDSADFALDDATNHTYGMSLHADVPKADLSILMMGLNDRNNSIPVATFHTNTGANIERIQAAGGDVLLVNPGSPRASTHASPPQSIYHTEMYRLADEYDLPLLDIAWLLTDWETANPLGHYFDEIHSNDVGLEFIARHLFNVLTGV